MRRLYILLVVSIIAGILAIYSSWCVAERSYNLAKALSERQDYVSDEIYYVDTARRYLQNIFNINITYYKYSNKTDKNYYNLEHPPLGKYIIALAMIKCGDKPLCWKMPSVIESGLIPLILYAGFLVRGLRAKSPAWIAAGGLAALAASSDKILHIDGSVAMLDIHLAFFTALAIALGIAVGYKTHMAAGAVATTVKMSGLAAVGGAFLALILDSIASRRWRDALKAFSLVVIVVLIAWIIIYLPLMTFFGPSKLYHETIAALKWHTSSRPPGPPTSTPIGWIFNTNPFILSYSLVDAAAETTTIVTGSALLAAIALSLYSLALAVRGRRYAWPVGSLTLVASYLMYALIYILGNHTFYSFYAVQMTPAAAASLGELTAIGLGGAQAWKSVKSSQ